mmetsp:Transcript_105084/g.282398  ORF Transcript_105084/g.282398 Transcript_105084/m.282398 type:complete len:209 (+) Transcript_105084:599-1225(+)
MRAREPLALWISAFVWRYHWPIGSRGICPTHPHAHTSWPRRPPGRPAFGRKALALVVRLRLLQASIAARAPFKSTGRSVILILCIFVPLSRVPQCGSSTRGCHLQRREVRSCSSARRVLLRWRRRSGVALYGTCRSRAANESISWALLLSHISPGPGIARTCAFFPRRGPSRSILDHLVKTARTKAQPGGPAAESCTVYHPDVFTKRL